jgi:ribosomal protein L2
VKKPNCKSRRYGVYINGKSKRKSYIKLRSGWQSALSEDCMASIGIVSNPGHKYLAIGKLVRSEL